MVVELARTGYDEPMDLKLKNKTALVTGGASGIGEAIVRGLAAEGVRVAIVDRNEERGLVIAQQLNGNHAFIQADLCSADDCKAAAALSCA